MNAPRRLPAGFSSQHSPRATLASVYSAHVALPSTGILLLTALLESNPSVTAVATVLAICCCSWVLLGVSLYRARFMGASRVWKYGEFYDATVVSKNVRDDRVELRLRWQQEAIVRIGSVAAGRSEDLEFEDARTVRIAVLDGHQPLLVPTGSLATAPVTA